MSRGGRPGLPSLISLTVSVDVKLHVYLLLCLFRLFNAELSMER